MVLPAQGTHYSLRFPRLLVSISTSLDDEGAGMAADRPIDSGISRLTPRAGSAIARLMSKSFNWWT